MQSVFFELLRSENKRGMIIFFSSHIPGEVQMFCKRVAIIKEGKIIQLEHSGKKLINLMIEEPSLDEIFMHYYKK